MSRGRRSAVVALVVIGAGSCGLRGGRPVARVAPAPVTSVVPGSTCPPAGADPQRLEIAVFAYCPATHTVAVGSEVTWSNTDVAPHTVTYDGPDGPVDSGSMAQGQWWSTRFVQAGTYRYYCRFHPGMTGTIVVEPVR